MFLRDTGGTERGMRFLFINLCVYSVFEICILSVALGANDDIAELVLKVIIRFVGPEDFKLDLLRMPFDQLSDELKDAAIDFILPADC